MTARDLPAYRVRRSSRARRVRLTISRAGEAVVVLPNGAPDRAASELVTLHAGWIERHLGRIRATNRDLAARPALGEGRRLLLGGTEHVVTVEATPGTRRSEVEYSAIGTSIIIRRAARDDRPPAAILEPWLRRRARLVIEERVAQRSAAMRVKPASVAIRDQRSRWGSASAGGNLSFSWRLVLCPADVLDYVVVHELAHLRVRGHSPAFWALVGSHFADAQAARRWLREHHAEVRHALD